MSGVGIDFGNANCVIALARRGGIDVVANEVSNRATPSMVGFQGEQRHIGEAAANFAMQNFKNTATDLKSLLGLKMASEKGQKNSKWVKNNLGENDSGSICAKSIYGKDGEPHLFGYEALSGALLSRLMQTASTENGSELSECVVSVPGYFSDLQRKAMLDAARIGNVKVLRLLNEHAAVALTYGIFRTAELPEEKPLKVAFIDVGQHQTTVAIADFLKSGVKVISAAHDEALGGRDYDEVLVQHFAAEFQEKFKVDAMSAPRATLRLRKECEKLKKVLSTVPESPLNIECFLNDVDVRGHMTRETYQGMIKSLNERVKLVCQEAVAGAGITNISDISAVEIIGGGSRVPSVKQTVSEYFGQQLKTTLNADEAIARGCSLMCAMLSPTVRVREYALTDISGYTLTVQRSTDADMVEGDDVVLVEKFGPVPAIKALSLKNAGPCTLTLKANKQIAIADYHVQAPAPQEGETAKMKVKIRIGGDGIAMVQSASLLVEEEVEVPVTDSSTKPETPAKSGGAEKASADAKTGAEGSEKIDAVPMETVAPETATDENAVPETPKTKKVKKTKTIDLVVTRGNIGVGLTESAVQASIDEEAEMKATDLYLKERSDALNALESYVYDSRSKLDDYGDLKEFLSDDLRQDILKKLTEAEDWIYSDESEEAAKSTFQEKRAALTVLLVPVQKRKIEFDERPVAASRLKDLCLKYKEIIVPNEKYDHITEEEKQTVVKACEETILWLTKEMAEQDALPKDVDPKLTTALISAKSKELSDTCVPVLDKPKPKVEEPAEKEVSKDEKMEETPQESATEKKPEGAAEDVEMADTKDTADATTKDATMENGD